MINLYKILHISPYSSTAEIRVALKDLETGLNERTVKAVHEWLLVDSVRARYDMKLRETDPEFFAQYRQQPIAAPTSSQNKRVIRSNVKSSSSRTISIKKKPAAPKVDYRVDVPELWNPNAASNWSLLFNVCFGAVIHALNWTELGEDKLAKANWIVATVWLLVLLYSMTFNNKLYLLNFLVLVAWYFTLGKKQAAYINTELNDHYRKKGWLAPIVIAVAVSFGLGMLSYILSSILGIS